MARYQLIGRRWRVLSDSGEVLRDGLPRREPHQPLPPPEIPPLPIYGPSPVLEVAEEYAWRQLLNGLGVPAEMLQRPDVICCGRAVTKSTSPALSKGSILTTGIGMNWIQTLERKQQDLEHIASWASMVNLGDVRDHCRKATAVLRREIEFQQSMAACTTPAPEPRSHCASDTPVPPPPSPPAEPRPSP